MVRVYRLICVGLLAAVALGAAAPLPAARAADTFELTLLHNNDGESALLSSPVEIEEGGETVEVGGVARFARVVRKLRRAGSACPAKGVLLISSGDNFLAGPQFNASLEKGIPFYDTLALDLLRYDASAIGNHEFDFGPDTLADFIRGFKNPPAFVTANLDFSAEPKLNALVKRGRISKSSVVSVCGQRFGIVGATTPFLGSISSPREVKIDPDVVGTVQTEIDALLAQGINKIIFTSHLQSVEEDLALIPQLKGIDIAIAGGGDELLANPDTPLLPGDAELVAGSYPLTAADKEGKSVPIVTTTGSYRYVGKLVAWFDAAGNVVSLDADRSGPVRVLAKSRSFPDGVVPDPLVQELVTKPVQAAVDDLAANIIGRTEVALDGLRTNVRTIETNEGNLVGDALLWQANQLAASFGAPTADVALQNGGGMRDDEVIPPGNITELKTFDILPFSNFVCIVPQISASQFKTILENAVSRVAEIDGRFAQIAGFRYTWDATGTAQVIDETTGQITTPGTRVKEVVLASGTVLVQNGQVVAGAPAVNIATIDFLARNGDQYPFNGAPFTNLAVSYQQALLSYITTNLSGVVTSSQYPEGGSGRITRLN